MTLSTSVHHPIILCLPIRNTAYYQKRYDNPVAYQNYDRVLVPRDQNIRE